MAVGTSTQRLSSSPRTAWGGTLHSNTSRGRSWIASTGASPDRRERIAATPTQPDAHAAREGASARPARGRPHGARRRSRLRGRSRDHGRARLATDAGLCDARERERLPSVQSARTGTPRHARRRRGGVFRYVSWLREAFQSFTIADSREPLVKEITWTRDVFPGARQAMLPDAVVSWTGVPTASAIASSILGTIAADLPTGRSGNHHPEGFTIVMERNGARGVATTPGDILDVKPTVFERLFAQA